MRGPDGTHTVTAVGNVPMGEKNLLRAYRAPEPQRPQQRDRKGDERRGGKLTVNRALGGDDGARARSLAAHAVISARS